MKAKRTGQKLFDISGLTDEQLELIKSSLRKRFQHLNRKNGHSRWDLNNLELGNAAREAFNEMIARNTQELNAITALLDKLGG